MAAAEGDVGVSLASVYNTLNGLEPGTSAALVRFAADRAREVIDAMPGAQLELLAGHADECEQVAEIAAPHE